MDNLPGRSPNSDPEYVRRYLSYYDIPRLINNSRLFFGLFGVLVGFGVGIYAHINFAVTAALGGLIFLVGFKYGLSRYLHKDNEAMDEWDESSREEREMEFQRQLAEAKVSGAFDRFGDKS